MSINDLASGGAVDLEAAPFVRHVHWSTKDAGLLLEVHTAGSFWVDLWAATLSGTMTDSLLRGVYGLVYSPDQARVAYFQQEGESWQLGVLDLSGRLTSIVAEEVTPEPAVWSPDGTQLAFLNGAGALAVVNVITKEQTTLATLEGRPAHIEWLPDGSAVVFSASQAGRPSPFVVRIASADGGAERALAPGINFSVAGEGRFVAIYNNQAPINIFDLQTGDVWAVSGDLEPAGLIAVAPDGTQVIFSARADSDAITDLFLVNIDGSNLRRLVDATGGIFDARWSANGGQIVFVDTKILECG